jgi:hypothetical protein
MLISFVLVAHRGYSYPWIVENTVSYTINQEPPSSLSAKDLSKKIEELSKGYPDNVRFLGMVPHGEMALRFRTYTTFVKDFKLE